MKRVGLVAAALMVLMLTLTGANTLRQWAGLTGAPDTPTAHRARVEPFWRVVAKDSAGTGGAVLLSGCDGVHDNMDFWADHLAEQGRRALIVDSHGPRGLDQYEAWRLVCIGQVLSGAERAGDLAVALSDAASPAGGTVVLGASHGGWTTMEFLRLAVAGQIPPGLQRWPKDPARLLNDLDAVVLLYPYCGLLNGADAGDWSATPPILMILAAEDRIVSTPACQEMAARLRARGAQIELVVLPEADHAFDQRERAAMSPLSFNVAQRDHAALKVDAFPAGLN